MKTRLKHQKYAQAGVEMYILNLDTEYGDSKAVPKRAYIIIR